ncbi:Anaerobic dimethyl sulfoxide reductase chain A [Dehalobacter sp. UNSWDHB]|nr:Anaerobic dimethyl sulfoxide reductase chain A [Dehalobacter sp. UNSWDHB]
MEVYRNVCPRNCFCTCSMLSYVENGKLIRVTGDSEHGFTKGKLCAKGYAYTQRVYDAKRILHPMRQYPRGSGRWHRITWDEAMDIVTRKMLELRGRYGSFWPICFNKQTGNIGMLHYALDGLFAALESTVVNGTSCWSAGLDAFLYTFGDMRKPDPEDMVNSKIIIIWGGNPAWTALHQMYYINQAHENGAKVIVIDPVFTATAAQADIFIQPKAGSDGALALGIAKYITKQNLYDQAFLKQFVEGGNEFIQYVANLSDQWIEEETGLPREAWQEVAHLYATQRPGCIWLGLGLQRHVNGGQNFRGILALAALTGNIGVSGAGVYYPSQEHWRLLTWQTRAAFLKKAEPAIRTVSLNNFAQEVSKLSDPPVKMLFLAGRDLWQDANTGALEAALEQMELVVQVDHFLNRSSHFADIFLPCTTQFEEWDLVPSYWHHWIAVNQKAIEPRGECRSDLQIAQNLAHRLNELAPGCVCTPQVGSEEEWVAQELSPELFESLNVTSFSKLLEKPRKLRVSPLAWADLKFPTPSGKLELKSGLAWADGFPLLPEFRTGSYPTVHYPYRLLTPHLNSGSNSQFTNLHWLSWGIDEPKLRINPRLAKKLKIQDNDRIRVYNNLGEVVLPVRITAMIPEDTILTYTGWFPDKNQINLLIDGKSCDMGIRGTGQPGIALYDTYVNLSVV